MMYGSSFKKKSPNPTSWRTAPVGRYGQIVRDFDSNMVALSGSSLSPEAQPYFPHSDSRTSPSYAQAVDPSIPDFGNPHEWIDVPTRVPGLNMEERTSMLKSKHWSAPKAPVTMPYKHFRATQEVSQTSLEVLQASPPQP